MCVKFKQSLGAYDTPECHEIMFSKEDEDNRDFEDYFDDDDETDYF